MNGADFHGVKIVLITSDNQVVTMLRDDKPGLPFPGMWDLPGGGREGNETPVECARREVMEELGIDVPRGSISVQKRYASTRFKDKYTYFFIAAISEQQVRGIVFGGEGQKWQLMSVEEFINHPNAVPDLQNRLQENLPPDS